MHALPFIYYISFLICSHRPSFSRRQVVFVSSQHRLQCEARAPKSACKPESPFRTGCVVDGDIPFPADKARLNSSGVAIQTVKAISMRIGILPGQRRREIQPTFVKEERA